MIGDALLTLFAWVLEGMASLLPVGELDLSAISGSLGDWVGQYAGPLDRFFPVHEFTQGLDIWFRIWLPAAVVFSITKFIYKHLPVFGKG